MRYRNSITAIMMAASVGLISGCSNDTAASPPPITGTVERSSIVGGNSLFALPKQNLIKLEGSSDVYVCYIGRIPACGLVQLGDSISLTAEVDKDTKKENIVTTLEIK